MDLADSPAEHDFRQRLRCWLDDHRPPSAAAGADLGARHDALVAWHRLLYAGAWVGLSWPRAYGGQGFGPMEEAILAAELAAAGYPPPLGFGYIGRPILAFGSESQKQRWLPSMLRGDVLWCQGFSEPGAGSDLAGLTTRAVRSPGGWCITGQKVWTSYAQFAGRCLLLARTGDDGPPHAGLSVFVLDMAAPGITLAPITTIRGDQEFCEVFLEGVEVDDEAMVGRAGQGWELAMTTLAYERGPVDIGFAARYGVVLDRLVRALEGGGRVGETDQLAVARAAVSVEVLTLQCLRSLTRRAEGTPPGPEGSVDKLLMATTEQHLLGVALDALGASPLLDDADDWFGEYLWSRAATIYGGTAQIQRNILATRVLGFPR